MKAKELGIETLNWSQWYDAGFGIQISYLHYWCELTHLEHHCVQIAKYSKNGKIKYEVKVGAGKYGEAGYAFEEVTSAKKAREIAEKAAIIAICNGDLTV